MNPLAKPQRDRPLLYIASPLFSIAEQTFNVRLKHLLEPYFVTYLPQEDGLLLANVVRVAQTAEEINAAIESIFQEDLSAIRSADVLLAVLDGRTIDEGTAFEIGFAYAIGKPCYGLQTDPRRLLPTGNNPMIARSLRGVFASLEELEQWASRYASQWSPSSHD